MRATRVGYAQLREALEALFLHHAFPAGKAALCAQVIADSTFDGVPSHGINMVPFLIDRVARGSTDPAAEPHRILALGSLERWDGRGGLGIHNAAACTARAVEMAREGGMGCVALANTNHWFRAGTYGWQAAQAGCALIAWTNTIPNMPAWGAAERSVGNNPLVLAVPRTAGPLVLDMAMSQFSLGRLKIHQRSGQPLPVPGGYTASGELSRDAAEILGGGRVLPMGFWKGSGLALMLDALAALLSGGLSTSGLAALEEEKNVSQVFLAFRPPGEEIEAAGRLEEILSHFHAAPPLDLGAGVRHPGQRTLADRERNRREGMLIDSALWRQVAGASS